MVSGLGAPGAGQAGNTHAALGNNFNGRNSSGLLYMHHGSLGQTANGGPGIAGGAVPQNASMQQTTVLQPGALQAKPSQSHNALQKMYQTQQNSRQKKGPAHDGTSQPI